MGAQMNSVLLALRHMATATTPSDIYDARVRAITELEDAGWDDSARQVQKAINDADDEPTGDGHPLTCHYECCDNEAAVLMPQIPDARDLSVFVYLPVCASCRKDWWDGGDFTEETCPLPTVTIR